jgi:hypothetical protein
MNKQELKNLITECIRENKLKKAIRELVVESIQELKAEKQQSCAAMMEELDGEVQKIDKSYSITKDDAGNYNLCGCPPHMLKLKHMYEDKFDLTYFKDQSARTKKMAVPFEEIKKFVKETLESKELGYVKKAYNKVAENDKDKEHKGGEEVFKRVGDKAKDMVEKNADLPDQPYKSVDGVKKQAEHSLKGEKADYKYPKQDKKDQKHVVKLPEKKSRGRKPKDK